MTSDCCNDDGCASSANTLSPRYRRALWIALVANLLMFGIELAASWSSHSASLIADAADFFGDSVNFGLSLFVLSLASIWRSRTAFFKGLMMGALGLFALGRAAANLVHGVVPEALTMGVIGTLALAVNLSVAVMLYAFRAGDANMRSVWLCARNDAINNLAVMIAALGVFGTGSGWPDLGVAAIMGVLGLIAARSVIRQALDELKPGHPGVSIRVRRGIT